jgi:hypothetical protein
MVSKGRLVERSLKRAPPRKTARPRVLVVTEGRATEPGYLHGLRSSLRLGVVDIEIDDRSGVPKTLVERAVEAKKEALRLARRQRDDNLKYDEIWCVYDIDDHPNLPAARDQAAAHNIQLAISNPSFELWLLLHYEDQRAFLHRDDAASRCRMHLPDYVKRVPFGRLADRLEQAEDRAEELARMHARREEPVSNPSTGVFALTRRFKAIAAQTR